MIKRLSALTALMVFGFGCAHDPATTPTPSGDSPAWNATPMTTDHRRPSSSDEDYIYEGGGKARLENCGGKDGTAKLVRDSWGSLVLQVRNIECASWTSKAAGFQTQKLGQSGSNARNHWADIPVNETMSGWHEVVIGSENFLNSYSTFSGGNQRYKGDIVRFYIPAKPVTLDLTWDGRSGRYNLPSCGGSVEAKITPDRQVAVIFRDVNRCSGFELTGANGSALDYQKDLDRQGDSYGGSRSIPKKYVENGYNGVYARIFRVGGGEDRIFMHFIGAP